MNNKELKPKLRFKGFKDLWDLTTFTKPYIKIIDGDRGVNYPKSNEFNNFDYCLFLNAQNVTKNGFVFNDLKFITKEKDQKLGNGKLERNDIVLTTRGTVGNFAYYGYEIPYENIRINSGMVLIRVDRNKMEPKFVYTYVRTSNLEKQLKLLSFGSAQPQLTVGGISKIKISFPSLKEQQKIASFLSAVDSYIENLKQQKEALEKYKKGMMQKIFSRQIRFKDENENEFPEWKEKSLGEVSKFWNGKAHEQEIEVNGKYIVINSKFISTSGEVRKYSNIQISPLYKNDITIVMSDVPNGKAIAKCFIVDQDSKYTLNQRIGGIRANKMNSKFLYLILNRNNYLLMFDNGVSQTNLRKEDILSCPLLYPCLEEQNKIAAFISKQDEVINAIQLQIEKAEQWKKGLLQQLFV